MREISIGDVQYIAHALARDLLKWNEPIPEFTTRFPNILESCLATPFQMFNKKDLYPGLVKKASILFYLMIKNHPFKNGNKRVAMTTTILFLIRNGKWLKVNNYDLYKFTLWVTESDAKLKHDVVLAIESYFRIYLVDEKERERI